MPRRQDRLHNSISADPPSMAFKIIFNLTQPTYPCTLYPYMGVNAITCRTAPHPSRRHAATPTPSIELTVDDERRHRCRPSAKRPRSASSQGQASLKL